MIFRTVPFCHNSRVLQTDIARLRWHSMQRGNKIDHNYLLPGPHDTDDIQKNTGSKVKVSQPWP